MGNNKGIALREDWLNTGSQRLLVADLINACYYKLPASVRATRKLIILMPEFVIDIFKEQLPYLETSNQQLSYRGMPIYPGYECKIVIYYPAAAIEDDSKFISKIDIP